MRINGDDLLTAIVSGLVLLIISVLLKMVRTHLKTYSSRARAWLRTLKTRSAVGRDGYAVLNAMRSGASFVVSSYEQVVERLDGQMSEERVLTVLTRLERRGLVRHRLEAPPHPRAVLTPTGDAGLLFRREKTRRKRMSTRVASEKRQQVAMDREWLRDYDRHKYGFISAETANEQLERHERLSRNLEDLEAAGLMESAE